MRSSSAATQSAEVFEFSGSGRSTDGHSNGAGTTLDPRVPTRPPGSTVGEYIILDKIGAGGMGVVYAAYDPKLDRKVALKVLRRALGSDRAVEEAGARMLAEGRALAKVSHRNVVTVFDVGRVDDEVYVAMELIEGQTLKQWRHKSPRPWPEVVKMFLGIAAGLEAVHDAGLVHRDVKPDNVLIGRDGEPRVTDFGLARSQADTPSSLDPAERALVPEIENSSIELTRPGARLGTIAYMSLEQLRGEVATVKSDQFSLCVALWECLYGQRPFGGDSWVSLMVAMTNGELRSPSTAPGGRPVPAWLRRTVLRGLELDPKERWPSIHALDRALRDGDPNRSRRRRLGALGAGVLAVGLLALGYARHQAQAQEALAACEATGAALGVTWTDDTRAKIDSRFAVTGVSNAATAAAEVTTTLDDFAGAWAEDRTAACVAGLSEPAPALLPQRIDCLEQRRGMFDSLVETFTEADDVVVKRAQRSAEGIADLASCRDEARLRNIPPLPDDPAARDEIRTLDSVLAKTQVHEHVGRYDEGQQVSDDALTRALTTGYRPLIALAHYRVAVFFEKRGKYEEAVAAWAASFREASLGGHDQLAAEAASALAFTEGYQLQRYDTGIRWAQLAGIYLERLEMTHTLTEATRLDVLAVLREMKGDYDASIATHHAALDLRRELVAADHHSIGYGLANLSGVLRNSGQLQPARAALLESRAIFEAAFGPDNPTTAHVLNNLAGLEIELGNHAEAEALLTRVKAIWSESLGPTHPDVGDLEKAFGDIRREQGAFDDAIARYRKAQQIYEGSLAADHPTVANASIQIGQVQWLAGRADEAEQEFERALEGLRKADDGQDDRRGRARHGLALVALHRGDAEAATRLLTRARADFEGHGDGHPRWVTRTQVGLAAAQLVAGDAAAAHDTLIALLDDAKLKPSVRAEALAWQARTRSAQGDEAGAEQARALAKALVADANADVQARIARLQPSAPETPE